MAAPRSRAARPIARGDIVLVLFPFTDLTLPGKGTQG
jgi:hypothetical protein